VTGACGPDSAGTDGTLGRTKWASPQVTVGMPAFNRPEGLRRALLSLTRQDYPNLFVVVADDCSPDHDLLTVVDDFRSQLNIRYVRNAHNVGLIANALLLLDFARSPYFMWLADDDEISSNFVSELVGLLESEPDAVTATGNWVRMTDSLTSENLEASQFQQVSVIRRMVHFVWHSDDAFFYGLHRTDSVRAASFSGFWWPNRGSVVNWCYILICDLVLQGRILRSPDPSVQWINHGYTRKDYAKSGMTPSSVAKYTIKRVNVHFEYSRKARNRTGIWAPLILVPTSTLSLLREFISTAPELYSRTRTGRDEHVRKPAEKPKHCPIQVLLRR
jgi:glycosyltransferase involved in cell wall biosynthesis